LEIRGKTAEWDTTRGIKLIIPINKLLGYKILKWFQVTNIIVDFMKRYRLRLEKFSIESGSIKVY
jgi:hypothetical protein